MSKIEIEFNSYKFNIEIKIESNCINFFILSHNFKNFQGCLSFEEIISQISLFEDYNIQEIYEILKELNSEKFILNENSGKYQLNIKINILKKEKILKVELVEFEKTKDQLISDLQNIKSENNSKITNLKEKYLKLIKECEELVQKKKDLEAKLLNKYYNEKEKEKESNKNDEIYKNFRIGDKKPKIILTDHPNTITCIAILTDGRLATGSYENIIIYSAKVYNLILNIKKKKFDVEKILGLSTGKMAVYFDYHNINIYHIQGKNAKIIQSLKFNEGSIYGVIEFENKSLAISYKNCIDIYSLNKDDTYSKSNCIKSFNMKFFALVQINPNELCVSCEYNDLKFLSFYNLDTKEPFAFIKEIPSTIYGYKLNSNIILFYKDDCVYVVNSIKHELLSKFQLDLNSYNEKNFIFSLGVLTSNMILIGDIEGNIIQCALENDELTEISRKEDSHVGKKEFSKEVSYYCILGDGHIATGGYDNRIKIW